MSVQNPVIEFEHVSYAYEKESVLQDIHFNILPGSFLGVIGPNGGGKSTLLKLLLGLLPLQEGRIKIFGQERERFRDWEKIGYVSQKSNAFNRGFPATVYEIVRSGLVKKTGMFRFFPKNTKEQVTAALRAVEMETFLKRNISELSGGEQQRIFIARAIVTKPQILILDEPTVGVDVARVESFIALLKKLNQELGMTIILVSHDLPSLQNSVSHILHLNRTIVYYGDYANYNKHLRRQSHPVESLGGIE